LDAPGGFDPDPLRASAAKARSASHDLADLARGMLLIERLAGDAGAIGLSADVVEWPLYEKGV
jgi:hypothetical protein